MRLSTEVETLTPRIDHYITDSDVNNGWCKKTLLASTTKDALSTKTVSLFSSLAASSRLRAQWAVPMAPKGDSPSDQEDALDLKTADNIFQTAKKTLTVVAAVKIIFEMRGGEQQSQATAILKSHRAALPGSIVRLLEEKTNVPAKAKSSKAKE